MCEFFAHRMQSPEQARNKKAGRPTTLKMHVFGEVDKASRISITQIRELFLFSVLINTGDPEI